MLLSKSDFKKYKKCPCHLWLHKFHRDWLPEDDGSSWATGGDEVDVMARGLFPGGIEIQEFNERGWTLTKAAIKRRARIIYQPTIIAGQLTCKADIIVYRPKSGKWDLYEVKSSAFIDKEKLLDAAFQWRCFRLAGIPMGRAFVVYVNREFVRDGDIDLKKFFVTEDVTAAAKKMDLTLADDIENALAVFGLPKKPGHEQVLACRRVNKCEFLEMYLGHMPVADLKKMVSHIGQDKLKELLLRGILEAKHIPRKLLTLLGELDLPNPDAPATVEVNAAQIRRVLRTYKYPLHFLDYETIGPAIPPFDGLHPYHTLPFQYTLMVIAKPGAKPVRYDFLAETFEDPSKALVAHLQQQIVPKGTVLAWNAGYEAGCNKMLAAHVPKAKRFLVGVNDRIQDLADVFKKSNGFYKHSGFNGSWSLKKVLPVLLPELSYDDLEIQEGMTASNSWFALTGNVLSAPEKKELKKNMIAYCGRDVEAMVGIYQHLVESSS